MIGVSKHGTRSRDMQSFTTHLRNAWKSPNTVSQPGHLHMPFPYSAWLFCVFSSWDPLQQVQKSTINDTRVNGLVLLKHKKAAYIGTTALTGQYELLPHLSFLFRRAWWPLVVDCWLEDSLVSPPADRRLPFSLPGTAYINKWLCYNTQGCHFICMSHFVMSAQ